MIPLRRLSPSELVAWRLLIHHGWWTGASLSILASMLCLTWTLWGALWDLAPPWAVIVAIMLSTLIIICFRLFGPVYVLAASPGLLLATSDHIQIWISLSVTLFAGFAGLFLICRLFEGKCLGSLLIHGGEYRNSFQLPISLLEPGFTLASLEKVLMRSDFSVDSGRSHLKAHRVVMRGLKTQVGVLNISMENSVMSVEMYIASLPKQAGDDPFSAVGTAIATRAMTNFWDSNWFWRRRSQRMLRPVVSMLLDGREEE